MNSLNYKKIIINIAILLSIAMFFSCSNTIEKVNRLYKTTYFPIGETYDVDLRYTVNAKTTTKLIAPLMLDYSNQDFKYQEFPEGIKVIFLDEKGAESILVADYGIVYKKSNLIAFSGDVQLSKPDGTLLKTEQLFYDEKNSHIFTEKSYTFTSPTLDVKGFFGFESNTDFTKFHSGDFLGNTIIKN